MTETLRWTWRLNIVRAYILILAVIGLLSGFDGASTLSSAVAQALAVGRTATLLLGPLVMALLWGVIADSAAEEAMFLAGDSIPRQRVRTAVAGASVLVAGVAAAALAALPVLLLQLANAPSQDTVADVAWDRALVHLALTLVATVAVSTALLAGRATVLALLLASVVLLLQVVAFYSASLPASVAWKVLWPGTAAMVVSEVGGNYTRLNATFAALSIAVWCVVAADRLISGRHERTRVRPRRVSKRSVSSPRPTLGLCLTGVVLLVVASAVLPAVARSAPMDLRPSLMLQRLDGTAPEQVVGDFFSALANGDEEAATSYVVRERGDRFVRRLPRLLRAPSYGPRFELAQVDGLRFAQVDAYIAAGVVRVSLVRRDDRWQISDIEPVG
ncbi:MAG: hypothetical protein JWO76_3338 [Nocardioides sp.]|nr:hypothetical protein [Nocardioides sp.]